MDQMTDLVSKRLENIVGKGENADYQHFLLFPQYFQKAYSTGRYISSVCVKELRRRKSLALTWSAQID